MSKWTGYAVSVNCGDPLGCYQGTILDADGSTITLTKAFRNGFPYPKAQVTLNAGDIKQLTIIETRAAEQPPSTVAVAKRGARATVCESLQANPSSSGNQVSGNNASGSKAGSAVTGARGAGAAGAGGGAGGSRSKPIDIHAARAGRGLANAGSYGAANSTPKSRGGGAGGAGSGGAGSGGAGGGGAGPERSRRRNEACFGELAEPALEHDFDFEGNLALFDKRALWEQMSHAHKPDLVRQADEAGGKFRHDENVLGGAGGGAGGGAVSARRAIRVPDHLRGPLDYVTDEAVCVPSCVPHLRRRLWEGMQRHGLEESARVLLARAAADVALRLVGGGRRLDPRNAHQTPTAVALVGAHRAGAAGLACARVLASHAVRVACHVCAPPPEGACDAVTRELAALALSGVTPAARLEQLPSADLVLLALYDLQLEEEGRERYGAALAWARAARAAVVALEPPADGWEGAVCARAAVLALLPAALAPALGRVYLADVAPPVRLFTDLRLHYRPPFGAAPVLALHPADE